MTPSKYEELAARCESQAVYMLEREAGAERYNVERVTYCARLLECAAALRARSQGK